MSDLNDVQFEIIFDDIFLMVDIFMQISGKNQVKTLKKTHQKPWKKKRTVGRTRTPNIIIVGKNFSFLSLNVTKNLKKTWKNHKKNLKNQKRNYLSIGFEPWT